ncbi:hypothetical protein PF005_g27588, partial [Phytophthora fragariae]
MGEADGGGSGNAPGLKETPIDDPYVVYRGPPDYTFCSLPYIQQRYSSAGDTYSTDYVFRMTSPYDVRQEMVAGDVNVGAGVMNVDTESDTGTVSARWFDYYAGMYKYYHVIGCKYDIFIENLKTDPLWAYLMPGALKCWIQILNSRLPTPQPNKIRTIAPAEVIRALADFLSPEHPWQQYRRRLPSKACLFDTEGFDPDRKVSQRAPPFLRLQGYWSNFRGDGNSEDVDLGFSLWERDHWIPRRVMEAFFKLAYRILEENDTWSAKQKAVIKRDLDAAKAAWLEYAVDRTRRSDRLRAKIVHQVWEWAVSKSPKFAKVDPEVLFEPSMPG